MEFFLLLTFFACLSFATTIDYAGILPPGYDINFLVNKGKYSDPYYASVYIDTSISSQNATLYCWSDLQNPAAYAKFYISYRVKPIQNSTYQLFGNKLGNDNGNIIVSNAGYYYIGMYADCSTCIESLKTKLSCRAQLANGTVLPPQLTHDRRTQLFDLTENARWQYFILFVGEENLLDGVFTLYLSLGISTLSSSTIVTYYKQDVYPTTTVYDDKYPGGSASAGEYEIKPWTLPPGRYYLGIYLVKLGSGVGTTCQASVKAGFNRPPTQASFRSYNFQLTLILLSIMLSLWGMS